MSEQHIPSLNDHPLNEQEIEYNKEVIHEILTNGVDNAYALEEMKNTIRAQAYATPISGNDGGLGEYAISAPRRRLLANAGLLDAFDSLISDFDEAIRQELETGANDVNEYITDQHQFEVRIVVGEEQKIVQGVITREDRIVPIVDGTAYEAPFDDVRFEDIKT